MKKMCLFTTSYYFYYYLSLDKKCKIIHLHIHIHFADILRTCLLLTFSFFVQEEDDESFLLYNYSCLMSNQ